MTKSVRIGAGCSVDITLAIPQMVRLAEIDYLVIDFMFETGVAGMAGDRYVDAEAGFAGHFLGPEIEGELRLMLDKKIKLVTNAGSLNPFACAAGLRKLAASHGLNPRIAVVHGDDVLDIVSTEKRRDMFSGETLPSGLASANAYLGAKPIAAALDKGADIVITGRVVDSALSLGPLMYEFGWPSDDYDRLAAGTLIGHLLECGPQPSGGIFTDWREIDWSNSSFPIAECFEDGHAVITKVDGTGGKVSLGTVAEQILYEIGDPQQYFMPDVTCDFSGVHIDILGKDRVQVSGAKGRPPTQFYKVSAVHTSGWRGIASAVVTGPASIEKGRGMAEAVLKRARRIMEEKGMQDFTATSIELIGSGASCGPRVKPFDAREIVYRVVADHPDKEAVALMIKISGGIVPSMAPGAAGLLGSSISPSLKMYSFLLEKSSLVPKMTIDGATEVIETPTAGGFDTAIVPPLPAVPAPSKKSDALLPLVALAWTRSGDKGDISNIGVIARKPEFLSHLAAALTEEAVAEWFAHLFTGSKEQRVDRYFLPGLNALNFVLYGALAGGAVSSMRFDPMGKGLGQQMLDFPIPVPQALAERLKRDTLTGHLNLGGGLFDLYF